MNTSENLKNTSNQKSNFDRKSFLSELELIAIEWSWSRDNYWERGKFQPTSGNYPDVLGNYGCEVEPQPDEPRECYGLGCQRGTCWVCREADDYWAFCATPECIYNNGEPMIRKFGAFKNSDGEIICYGCASNCKNLELSLLEDICSTANQFWINWNYNAHEFESDEWLDDDSNENNKIYVSQIDYYLNLPPWAGEDPFQDVIEDGSLVTGSFVNGTFIPEYETTKKMPGCSESRLNSIYLNSK